MNIFLCTILRAGVQETVEREPWIDFDLSILLPTHAPGAERGSLLHDCNFLFFPIGRFFPAPGAKPISLLVVFFFVAREIFLFIFAEGVDVWRR